MVTCPWCGITLTQFQPICPQCGGSLTRPPEETPQAYIQPDTTLLSPPFPPREVPPGTAVKIFFADALAVVMLVFSILGVVDTLVGVILTTFKETRMVGYVFLPLGLCTLAVGLITGATRIYRTASILRVLREGSAAIGRVLSVERNYSVRINGVSPWLVTYQFEVLGQVINGKMNTLELPTDLKASQSVYVLYDPEKLKINTLYFSG